MRSALLSRSALSIPPATASTPRQSPFACEGHGRLPRSGAHLSCRTSTPRFLVDGIRHHHPTDIALRPDIVVAVLEILQLFPVTAPQPRGPRLHMHIVHMSSAVGEARDQVQQPRADDVANLQARVVVAMTKRGEFDLALVTRECAGLLGEDRVGDPQVFALVAAVGDAQAPAIALGQMMLEVRTQALYRGRVHGCAFER